MSRTHRVTDDQQAILADLGRHPGWTVLTGVVNDKKEQEFRSLAKKIMRGEYPHPDEIEYLRGFFDGMKHLLRNPTFEAKKFEKALIERGEA